MTQQTSSEQSTGRESELRKIAHNGATASENKIHDDAEARRLGLRGGLVPGVTLYAYLTELLLPLYGPAWLERGTCSVRFVRPVYDGEEVVCRATGVPGAPEDVLDLSVRGPDGDVCVTGRAALPEGEPALFDPPHCVASAVPHVEGRLESRPLLTRESAPIGSALLPRSLSIGPAEVEAYADEATDPTPWYRGGSPFGLPIVPAGLLAGQPARLLRQNFEYGPSVHTGSVIQHLRVPLAGGEYRVDGTLLETYSKRGNDYLVMDVLLRDHTGAPVERIRHTSIFSFAPRN